MAYESIDKVQKVLEQDVFFYAKDSKKAAGRALGTLIEIITFYLIKTWKFNDSISIERGLAEYGNPEITHNVEYSLHPILNKTTIDILKDDKSITANRILNKLENKDYNYKSKNSLLKDNILRNACTIANSDNSFLIASLEEITRNGYFINIVKQHSKPYAIFECKRVGVEEGNKKGPQTIEKAKQGAYVARTVSSLQKVRTNNGDLQGIIYKSDNSIYSKPYTELVEEVIFSDETELLRKFVLTVGVVSNHGNWFTSNNQNKELKVLGQSYDWLLFLTDDGLSEFIETLILSPSQRFLPIKEAFIASYAEDKKRNQFTKTQMSLDTDIALQAYFQENIVHIESWFNIISPVNKTIENLRLQLNELRSKNWKKIL